MALPPELVTFVQAAVRLPYDRLKAIDRAWDQLYPHRVVLAELVQGSEQLRHQIGELRAYVAAEARRVAAEREEELLIPEDIAEAVFPAARAVLMRKMLENSTDQRRAQAFAELTRPFADLIPRARNGADRRGDR
jgi:hypothetical protein